MGDACELTILMPCLNEAETLGRCIAKARAFLERSGVAGEVLIADNGSTDGSQKIAEASGARVVAVAQRGYGSALQAGIRAARGTFVIMGDGDDSYDFAALDCFVEMLREGHQLVMGNVFILDSSDDHVFASSEGRCARRHGFSDISRTNRYRNLSFTRFGFSSTE